MAVDSFVKAVGDSVTQGLLFVSDLYVSIPGSNVVTRYIQSSYQNDPFRVALEALLVFFAIKYLLTKKYRPNDNTVKLTEKVSSILFLGGKRVD